MNVTATVLAAAGMIMLIWMLRRVNPGAILLSAATGLAALFAADLVLGFTKLNLPVNVTTVCCAAAGGVPGVILITLLLSMLGV